jgi:hypothetical protein
VLGGLYKLIAPNLTEKPRRLSARRRRPRARVWGAARGWHGSVVAESHPARRPCYTVFTYSTGGLNLALTSVSWVSFRGQVDSWSRWSQAPPQPRKSVPGSMEVAVMGVAVSVIDA